MKTSLTEILIEILKNMTSIMSPELREMIRVALANLYQHAEQTKNPFDNIAILLLAALIGFSKEDLTG